MEKKAPSLNTVALFNILSPLVLNGLAFFTMPIFTRLLGTAAYGLYTNYASYCSILAVFIGFQAAGAIAPASICYDKEERDKCFSNIITMGLLSALLIGLIMLVFAGPISVFTGLSKPMLVVLFFHSTGIFTLNFATAKYAYDKNSLFSFIVSVGLSVANIGLSLAMILYFLPNARYEGYAIGHALPYTIIGLILAFRLLKKGKSYFHKKYWRLAISLCLPLIFHQLSNSLLHQCDKIMLKQFTTDSTVGIYGFAVVFANILSIVWGALNTTFIPFYHDDIKTGDQAALDKKTDNYVFLFTCLAIGFIMVSPEVAKLFGAPDFWPATRIIPILAFGFYLIFLYSFPVNFEFYHRQTRTIALGTCFAAVINVILNYFFIHLWGMVGAAVATVASCFFLWVFHSVLSRIIIKKDYPFKTIPMLIGLGFAVFGLILFYVLENMWLIRWGIFTVLGIAILIKVIKQKSIF